MLLIYIAGTGNAWDGAWLMGMNGVGRVVPLVFLSVLAMLGVNALPGLLRRKELVDRFIGWLWLASVLITLNGIFGHLWYEGDIFTKDSPTCSPAWLGGERVAERPRNPD